jgi:uncharacterized protein (DUF305 family)
LIIAFVLAVGISACNSSKSATKQANSTNETAEMEQLYWARQDSAKMNFTPADVHFMTGMIAHHAQALIMSRMAPENGASSSLQTLASRIINSQKDEIKTMQKWLRDRDQPVPEVEIDGLKLMIHGLPKGHMKMDYTTMAGMLSPAQLKELSEARGKEFDRLYLTYMIGHHSGAVTMVSKLFDTNGAAQDELAFKIANDIQVDQRTEIARMQRMLDHMAATDS